jgi:hypothetical protein
MLNPAGDNPLLIYFAKVALLFGCIKWSSAGAQSMSDV